jgi:hypothetical protein
VRRESGRVPEMPEDANPPVQPGTEATIGAGVLWSLAAQQFSQIMAAQGGFRLAAMIHKSVAARNDWVVK